MDSIRRFLVTLGLTACVLADNIPKVHPEHQSPGNNTPKYRISPIDGSKIALPSPEQLAWQDMEIGTIIHFNIATYIDSDGCNGQTSLVPNQTLFDPTSLNTDQWLETITALGAGYATLVAKHNCGFTTWPSNVTFSTREGETIPYNYTIAYSPVHGDNVVQSFVDSANKYGIGHGFYYSTVWNNFLNVQNSEVLNTSWAPGQVNISNSTYDQIISAQLTDLWSNYGILTEVWLDGGFSSEQQGLIENLLQAHQPQAVVFNGCSTTGNCLNRNAVRWIGTELGQAPDPNWSTGLTNDGGDPTSPYFAPAECDTTLQSNDRWFWGANQSLRSPTDMINVYHNTVGRNCLLELDVSPDRTGVIPDNYVSAYTQLGNFISSCYGNPIDPSNTKHDTNIYSLLFNAPTLIDRIVLMEDQTNGQVIRSYQVLAAVGNSTSNGLTLVSNGTSVGHKKIDLLSKPIYVTEVIVNATSYVDKPVWRSITVHLCSNSTSS